MRQSKPLLAAFSWLVLAFLALPIVVVVIASFSPTGNMRVPLEPFSLSGYRAFLSDGKWWEAIAVSAALGACGALISTIVATLAALVNARYDYPGKALLEAGILAPLVFPHAALALALYGVALQIDLLGTVWGVFLAHLIITLPFAYRPISAAMHKFDRSMEEAAMSLGAAGPYVFRRVTVPVLRPGIVTALLFSFIISFDEATVTMFLKGPEFNTLPVLIFAEVQEGSALAVPAISTVLIALTFLFIWLVERTVGLQVFVDKD